MTASRTFLAPSDDLIGQGAPSGVVGMSEQAVEEARFDFFPDNYPHRRSETPEAAIDRRLTSLKENVAYYAGKLAAIRAAKPGDVINNIIHDAALIAKVEAGLVKQLDRVGREYRELATAETHAACDRAECMPVSIFRAAAE